MLKSLGLKRKIRLGPRARPILVALAASKALRGTTLDPFGRASVRKLERALRDEFIATLLAVAPQVDDGNYDAAVAVAELPDMVRGYEDLKVRRAAEYRTALSAALQAFRATTGGPAPSPTTHSTPKDPT